MEADVRCGGGGNHRFGLDADGSAGGDGFAEHVAGRQVHHSARRLQPRGLRALAGAGRAEKNDVEHGVLSPERRAISAVAAWS